MTSENERRSTKKRGTTMDRDLVADEHNPPPLQTPCHAPRSHDDNGVCMVSTVWKEQQHPDLLQFIASFLRANSYRLNFLSIAPDFIFNNGGISVAFNFLAAWDYEAVRPFFSRLADTKRNFRNLYGVVCLRDAQQTDSFNRSFFRHQKEFGSPPIVPVKDPEMGFQETVKLALARGVIRRHDIVNKMKIEREQGMQGLDMFLKVVTSIPGIDNHDANMLFQAIGSIEAISKASKNFILQNTDLSVEKTESIFRFFRDPEYFLRPKINRAINQVLPQGSAEFQSSTMPRYTRVTQKNLPNL